MQDVGGAASPYMLCSRRQKTQGAEESEVWNKGIRPGVSNANDNVAMHWSVGSTKVCHEGSRSQAMSLQGANVKSKWDLL